MLRLVRPTLAYVTIWSINTTEPITQTVPFQMKSAHFSQSRCDGLHSVSSLHIFYAGSHRAPCCTYSGFSLQSKLLLVLYVALDNSVCLMKFQICKLFPLWVKRGNGGEISLFLLLSISKTNRGLRDLGWILVPHFWEEAEKPVLFLPRNRTTAVLLPKRWDSCWYHLWCSTFSALVFSCSNLIGHMYI